MPRVRSKTSYITMANKKLVLPLLVRFILFAYDFFKYLIHRSDNTINRRIDRLFYIKSPAPTTKLISKTTRVATTDIPIDPSRNLWFRLFVPTPIHATTGPSKPLPFILYFHGGGFSLFGPDHIVYDYFCSRLAAKTQSVVASINYRLTPEHRYPCQYDDAFDSLKFINSENHAVLPSNTDLNNCFIAGDSAGGNIAHHLTVRACRNPKEFDKLRIAGLLSFQPFFGGEERTEAELRPKSVYVIDVEETDGMWGRFLPESADRNHHAVNVLNSTRVKSVETFPKTLVAVGGYDILQDWQRRYVEWLKEEGKEVELIEYPNAIHAFFLFPQLQENRLFFQDVKDFIRRQT